MATGFRLVAEKGEEWVYVEVKEIQLVKGKYPSAKSCVKFEDQLRTKANEKVKDLVKALKEAEDGAEFTLGGGVGGDGTFIVYVDKLALPAVAAGVEVETVEAMAVVEEAANKVVEETAAASHTQL